MSFHAEILASLGWRWTDGATFDARLDFARTLLAETGLAATWLAERHALGSGESETHDLTYLTRQVLGDRLVTAFVGIQALLIVHHLAEGGVLRMGEGGPDAWLAPFGAGPLSIGPDGAALLASRAAPWPVDGGHRNLRLAAHGGEVQYSIALLGVTAGAGSGA